MAPSSTHLLLLVIIFNSLSTASSEPCGNSAGLSQALARLSDVVRDAETPGSEETGSETGPSLACDTLFTCPSPLLQLARLASVRQRPAGGGNADAAGSAALLRRHKTLRESVPDMVAGAGNRPGLLGLLLLWLDASGEGVVVGERGAERAVKRRRKVNVLEAVKEEMDFEKKWLRSHPCPRSSFYAVSLSVLSACVSDSAVDADLVSTVIEASRDDFRRCPGDTHSTMSVCAMALSCVSSRPTSRSRFPEKLSEDVGRAARDILRRLASHRDTGRGDTDGDTGRGDQEGVIGSIFATPLAMQAMLTADRLLGFSPRAWDCAASERALIVATLSDSSSRRGGEGGGGGGGGGGSEEAATLTRNPAAAAHALIALSGSSLDLVSARQHRHHQHHQEEKEKVDHHHHHQHHHHQEEKEVVLEKVERTGESKSIGGVLRHGIGGPGEPRGVEEEEVEVELRVRDTVGGRLHGRLSLRIPQGTSLLAALRAAAKRDEHTFGFVSVPTVWGPYLSTVGGVTSDPDTGAYWRVLGPSGHPTQQGIRDVILNNGDTITLEFVRP